MYYGIVDSSNNITHLYDTQGIFEIPDGHTEIKIDEPIIDLVIAHHVYDADTKTISRATDEHIETSQKAIDDARQARTEYEQSVFRMNRLLSLRALKSELSVTTYDDEISSLETLLGV